MCERCEYRTFTINEMSSFMVDIEESWNSLKGYLAQDEEGNSGPSSIDEIPPVEVVEATNTLRLTLAKMAADAAMVVTSIEGGSPGMLMGYWAGIMVASEAESDPSHPLRRASSGNGGRSTKQ